MVSCVCVGGGSWRAVRWQCGLWGRHARASEAHTAWQQVQLLCLFPLAHPAMQLLLQDLKTGVCPAHEVACLVVDECHRCGR